MLVVGNEHDRKATGKKLGDGVRGKWLHLHEAVHDGHLGNNVLDDALGQRQAMRSLRAWNPGLLGLAVESESLVLPILVQSGLEVAATLVAREAESLGLLGLVDCEKNKFSVRSHERVATPNDPKLSDGGGWRAGCMAGGKAVVEAASVTAGAVRCSAWLAVSGLSEFA